MGHYTIKQGRGAVTSSKPVRNLAVVTDGKYGQIGIFARLETAFPIGDAKGIGS